MPAHERKCWDCGSVAEHADNVTPEVLCKKCGSQDTRPTKRPKPFDPSAAQLHSACLSYRHDYGVMSEEARKSLQFTALEWFRAWQKEGVVRSA